MTTPDSLIGKQIDQFRVEKYISRGAMGMVFKAFDAILARTVALKVIPKGMEEGLSEPERASLEEGRKRLIQEAKAAGRLSHPNIVTIHCYGETEDLQYICMEFVEGKTLTQLLGERKTLPEEEVIPILMQVLSALEAANREDIIHRDIKPSNIMVTSDNRVKVMDFGIAKLPSLSMTVTGMVLGTPFYMSPEQISGQKVDIRSDIFSTGAVLYELLTGQKPFPGDTTATLTYKILQHNPAPPDTVNAGISAPMSEITLRALAKDPAERYQTPTAMLNALRTQQEKLTARSMAEAATVAGKAMDAFEPTVLAARPEPLKGAQPPPEKSTPPARPVEDGKGPSPSVPPAGPEAGEPKKPDKRTEPDKHTQPDEPAPEKERPKPSEGPAPDLAGKSKPETPKPARGSRAIGVAALLLLVFAAAFIVAVSLRPADRSPVAPVAPGPPSSSPPAVARPETPMPSPAPAPPDKPQVARSPDSLLLEAGKHFVSHPTTARRLLEEALTVDPGHFESLMMLARLSTFQKDYAGAIKHYEAALRANSQAGEAYFELGSLLVVQGEYDAAVRTLEACLALTPRNRDDVLTSLGFAYWKLNNPQKAIRLYEEALSFNPQNERARALMATAQTPVPSQVPAAPSKPGPPKVEGKYAVEGLNPNGSRYRGTATITRGDGRYTLRWNIGNQSYSGSGSLSGNTLTVTWKGPTGEGGLVVYTLAQSGVLKGMWADGKGSETLTPLK